MTTRKKRTKTKAKRKTSRPHRSTSRGSRLVPHEDSTGSVLEVSRAQLAELLGVTPDHVTRLVGQGLPCLRRGSGRGRVSAFDAAAALAWVRERQASEGPAAKNFREKYLEALTARTVLGIRAKKRELVPKDQVILAGQSYTRAWTAKVRAIPRECVMRGIVPRERQRELEDLVRDLLVEISEWKTLPKPKEDK